MSAKERSTRRKYTHPVTRRATLTAPDTVRAYQSIAGGLPLSWTMDHVGPITRTAADAALALKILAGPDPADEKASRRPVPDYPEELTARIRGLRIGVEHRPFSGRHHLR